MNAYLDDLVGEVQIPVSFSSSVTHETPLPREISRETKVLAAKGDHQPCQPLHLTVNARGNLHAGNEFGIVCLYVKERILLEDMLRSLLLLRPALVLLLNDRLLRLDKRHILHSSRTVIDLDLFGGSLFRSFRCRGGDCAFLCRDDLGNGVGSGGSFDDADVEATSVLVVRQQSETTKRRVRRHATQEY